MSYNNYIFVLCQFRLLPLPISFRKTGILTRKSTMESIWQPCREISYRFWGKGKWHHFKVSRRFKAGGADSLCQKTGGEIRPNKPKQGRKWRGWRKNLPCGINYIRGSLLAFQVLLRRCKSCDDAQVSFPLNSDIRSCAVMQKHFWVTLRQQNMPANKDNIVVFDRVVNSKPLFIPWPINSNEPIKSQSEYITLASYDWFCFTSSWLVKKRNTCFFSQSQLKGLCHGSPVHFV